MTIQEDFTRVLRETGAGRASEITREVDGERLVRSNVERDGIIQIKGGVTQNLSDKDEDPFFWRMPDEERSLMLGTGKRQCAAAIRPWRITTPPSWSGIGSVKMAKKSSGDTSASSGTPVVS